MTIKKLFDESGRDVDDQDNGQVWDVCEEWIEVDPKVAALALLRWMSHTDRVEFAEAHEILVDPPEEPRPCDRPAPCCGDPGGELRLLDATANGIQRTIPACPCACHRDWDDEDCDYDETGRMTRLVAEWDALDAAYADSEAWHAERAEGAEEIETEDPVRDGWIGKDGRP